MRGPGLGRATDMFFDQLQGILLIVGTLFPIVNPIGGSLAFLLLTAEDSTAERRLLARQVAINSFLLLILSVLVGTHILSFFGISLPVVQVGGALVVISTGWTMLTRSDPAASRDSAHQTARSDDISGAAFYPLTLPLTVGPGSISVAITLGANESRQLGANVLAIFSVAIASVLIALSVYLCYAYADRMAAAVGPRGMNVIMRLSAFLLVCIGVQILWNGASALLKTLII